MLKRIVLGFALPPLIGSILFIAVVLAISSDPMSNEDIGLIFGLSFLFMGFQALIYSVAMEFWVQRKFKRKVHVISVSSAIGFLSGCTLVTLIPFLPVVGLLAGLFTEIT